MKKILAFIAVWLFIGVGSLSAQEKKYQLYGVGFYNLENLFDTCHDEGHNDYQYLPDGQYKWTGLKYTHKLRNMARVLAEMGSDRHPMGCAVIGVSEVENAKCLTDLCAQEPLKARNMQFVHVEGPDQRGVDCALLYNPAMFQVRDVKLYPYVYVKPEDSLRATRGFLTVSGTMAGDHVTIIVNHLPSRFAGSFSISFKMFGAMATLPLPLPEKGCVPTLNFSFGNFANFQNNLSALQSARSIDYNIIAFLNQVIAGIKIINLPGFSESHTNNFLHLIFLATKNSFSKTKNLYAQVRGVKFFIPHS